MYSGDDAQGADSEKPIRMIKLLEVDNAQAWKGWKREEVHGLMESHRPNNERGCTSKVSEIVLIVGDEKNRRE